MKTLRTRDQLPGKRERQVSVVLFVEASPAFGLIRSLALDDETTVPWTMDEFDAGGNCEISMTSFGGTNLAGSGSDSPAVASVAGIPFNRSADSPWAAVPMPRDAVLAIAFFASSVFPAPLYDTGKT